MILEWLERRELARKLKHCPHSRLEGVYEASINHCGGWRLHCMDCGRYIDGPVALAEFRCHERDLL